MPPEPIKIDELPWELRINGILLRSVQIRWASDSAEDFQLVITHPTLGPFSLHDGFELEMREQGSHWHPVRLEQLKKSLVEGSEFLHADDIPKSSEIAERRLFNRLDAIDIPHRRSPRLSELTGHDECVADHADVRVRRCVHAASVLRACGGFLHAVNKHENWEQ